MIKRSLAAAVAALFAAPAFALTPFVVKDIRVEGIQRTEAGTVFNYLPVKVGDTFDDSRAADAIRALYATGFFKDVRLEQDGDVLVVQVVERPAISQINISGAKEFNVDQLKKALKEMGVGESRIYDKSLLDQAEQELKRQYFSRGKYGVEVKTTVTPLERNRVALNFDIAEGVAAKIKQIRIVGNQAFSEDDLIDEMQLSTSGWMTWLSKNDQYSKQKLAADIESLKSFYQNRGYLEFNVDSTQVNISPDKEDIYITVNVTEGKQYKVADVKLAGELLVPEDQLKPLIQLKSGDVFNRERLVASNSAIADRLSNDGYAFANVNAVPELDRDKQTVSFTFFVDPGRRVYVRRINVLGNTRTRDEVVRREFRQMEGAWYAGDKIKRSRDRVDLLGYFTDVGIETPAVAGTTDQVDVDVTVKEKPTGNLSLGVGYGQSEGAILSASIAQSNIFGSGKYVSASINTSKSNRTLAVSYTDPYYTVDGLSVGYDAYVRRAKPDKIDTGKYSTSSAGLGGRLGLPIGEEDTLNFGLTLDQTKLESNGSPVADDYISRYGKSSHTLIASTSWAQDTRDSATAPNKGVYQNAALELGTPGSTVPYWKASYQYQRFFPFGRDFTLMLNGELAFGRGLKDNHHLPFYRNFYAGGIGSVRGYEGNSLGPRDSTDAAIGGDKRVVMNAELFFPFPGMKHDRTLRLSAFVDAGNVFGPGDAQGVASERFSFGELRYSTGVALSWISPLGPLKFSIAQPFKSKSSDKKQRFQFQLGTTF